MISAPFLKVSVARGGIGAMTQLLLDRAKPAPFKPLELDPEQLKIVQHRSGAMRVLAGPGTGKTTTLVAAMAARLTGDDKLQSDQVLGLTFGRRAALDWRARVTLAVGGGLIPQVSTFHSFCYGLLRKYQPQLAVEAGIRLLSGPEQQVRVRELFLGAIEDGTFSLPAEYDQAISTSGLIEEIRAVMSRTRSHLMSPGDLINLGQSAGRPMWELIGQFLETY
ncbi:MAG: UvrD-helicase domain-containing protein, partial [Actinomycetales bacterium]|nr:UvrD-helicase domain-containing protein [Actinomycetales bacterium]